MALQKPRSRVLRTCSSHDRSFACLLARVLTWTVAVRPGLACSGFASRGLAWPYGMATKTLPAGHGLYVVMAAVSRIEFECVRSADS